MLYGISQLVLAQTLRPLGLATEICTTKFFIPLVRPKASLLVPMILALCFPHQPLYMHSYQVTGSLHCLRVLLLN